MHSESLCDKCGIPGDPIEQRNILTWDAQFTDPIVLENQPDIWFVECPECGVRFYSPWIDHDQYYTRLCSNESYAKSQSENYTAVYQIYKTWVDKCRKYAGSSAFLIEPCGGIGYACHVNGTGVLIDVDAYAIDLALPHIGETLCCRVDEYECDGKADIVLYNDGIEHTMTPYQDLLHMRGWLRKGGVLFVKTFFEDLPGAEEYIGAGHQWHFTLAILTDWLKCAGFEVLETEVYPGCPQGFVYAKKV